jgi:hypothetical protein
VGLCVIIFCLPTVPSGVFFSKGFSWSSANYAPLVMIGVIGIVAIWYFGWAKKTFKGPIRTIDDGVFHELDGLEEVTPGPSYP